MEWAAFNENDDDSQRRERNRHHHREGDFDEENDQNQKQGLIRGENENNNDAETQKRKRRTAEAEETRIAGSYETAIRLLAEEEEEDNNEEGGENVILKEEAKREEAKQILLAVVNHEMMRENDELTPTLCSVKKLALRNLGNLFAKECGEFEFEGRGMLVKSGASDPASPSSWAALLAAHPWARDARLVAKPDQLIKRRGKAGLLAIDKTFDECRAWVDARMNATIDVEGVDEVAQRRRVARLERSAACVRSGSSARPLDAIDPALPREYDTSAPPALERVCISNSHVSGA